MLRRSFLASAAALLTLPVSRLFGARKSIRTSELKFGEPEHIVGRHVIVDSNAGGFTFERCSFGVDLPDDRIYCVMFNHFHDCRNFESVCYNERIRVSHNLFSGRNVCGGRDIECVPA